MSFYYFIVFKINNNPGPGQHTVKLSSRNASYKISKPINPDAEDRNCLSRIPSKIGPGIGHYTPSEFSRKFTDCVIPNYSGNRFSSDKRKVKMFEPKAGESPGPG